MLYQSSRPKGMSSLGPVPIVPTCCNQPVRLENVLRVTFFDHVPWQKAVVFRSQKLSELLAHKGDQQRHQQKRCNQRMPRSWGHGLMAHHLNTVSDEPLHSRSSRIPNLRVVPSAVSATTTVGHTFHGSARVLRILEFTHVPQGQGEMFPR